MKISQARYIPNSKFNVVSSSSLVMRLLRLFRFNTNVKFVMLRDGNKEIPVQNRADTC